MSKVCTKCGVWKDLSEFYCSKHTINGRLYYAGKCKKCKILGSKNNKIYFKEWTKSNRDKYLVYKRKHRERCIMIGKIRFNKNTCADNLKSIINSLIVVREIRKGLNTFPREQNLKQG